MLMANDGKLGWGGLTLGMTRATAEQMLGHTINVRRDEYADVCGELYSSLMVRGRTIRVDWTSTAPDGVIEVIVVPYGGGERLSYDDDLSQAAVAAVPALIVEPIEKSGDCPSQTPHFLVLRSDREQAVNLKSSGEGQFYVTQAGCVD